MGYTHEKPGEPEPNDASTQDCQHSERDTIPLGLDLKRTVPTGAALQATWKLPALRITPSAPPSSTLELPSTSGIRRMELPEAVARSFEAELARGYKTTLPSFVPGVPVPAPTAAPVESIPAGVWGDNTVLAAPVQPVGAALDSDESTRGSSLRTTDPFGHPSRRPEPAAGPGPAAAIYESSRAMPRTAELSYLDRGSEAWLSESLDTPSQPRKRDLRWWAVGAAALLCSLYTLYSEPGQDATLPIVAEGLGGELSAAGREVVATAPHLVQPSVEPESATQVSEAARAAVSTTIEIVSAPPGAEILAGDVPIVTAPARIARPSFEADYLLRLPGYDSQFVRLGPSSPSTLLVTLKPTAPSSNAKVARASER